MPQNHITYAEIRLEQVQYDPVSRLFPFSPRQEISDELVERIYRSILETGFWQPIILKADDYAGIAGNHRFLAMKRYLEEREIGEVSVIPALLVDCDPDTALLLALTENEMREELTKWELVRSLGRISNSQPAALQRVFEVDEAMWEQLALWPEQSAYEEEQAAKREDQRKRLSVEWGRTINTRLKNHPDLRKSFMRQLTSPSWMKARSLEELEVEITDALRQSGRKFEQGKTWNPCPTAKCMNCSTPYPELEKAILLEPSAYLDADGVGPTFCPHLRLFSRTVEQVIPLVVSDEGGAVFPPREADTTSNVLAYQLEAYCVDPQIGKPKSCFREQEAQARQEILVAAQGAGGPFIDIVTLREKIGAGEFVWQSPERAGTACTPGNCRHATDEPPGFVQLLEVDGTTQMVCVHQTCGADGQAERAKRLLDAASENQRELETAVNELCRESMRRVFIQPNSAIALDSPRFLEQLEGVLVPDWDSEARAYALEGWADDPDWQTQTAATGQAGFRALREFVIERYGLGQLLTYLALIRMWRNEANEIVSVRQWQSRIANGLEVACETRGPEMSPPSGQ